MDIVLLDACVLESRYLRPILSDDVCRDVHAIVDHGCQPAVLQKTLGEVWSHAKLGGGNTQSWAGSCPDYPGPFDHTFAAIRNVGDGVDEPGTSALWFNLAQEWYDFSDELDESRREFLSWKQKMERFCAIVESRLIAAGVSVVSPWYQDFGPRERHEAFILEREIGVHSLIPNEDLAWVLDALAVRARAVVTEDLRLINRGCISLGFNLGAPAFVHPSRLAEALESQFDLAVYPPVEANLARPSFGGA